MAYGKVDNQELSRGYTYKPLSIKECVGLNVPVVDLVSGQGALHQYTGGAIVTTDTPYVEPRGSQDCAVLADGDILYWRIPLNEWDLTQGLSFGLEFTSSTAAAAGKTFLPVMLYNVIQPGGSSSTGDAAAIAAPPTAATSPDVAFGAHTLLAQNTLVWSASPQSLYTPSTWAQINGGTLNAYGTAFSYLLAKVTFGTFTVGLTDLAVSALIVRGAKLIGPTPCPTLDTGAQLR